MESGRVQRAVPKDATAPRGVVLVVERVGKFHRLVDHRTAGALVPVLERVVCALSTRDEALKVPRTRVLSADRVTLSVGGVATVRVADPRLAAYAVEDVDATIRLVASACLRAAAATLPAVALRAEPQRLVDATRSRIHDALSQWGCQCSVFSASAVRLSDGGRTRSREKDAAPIRKSPSAAAVSAQTQAQPATPVRQNKYSARRQGSLLAQHLLDENSRLSGAGTLSGRAAAAAAVAEVAEKRVAGKGDAPSPGWLVPSPPPGRAVAPHPRKDTRSPAQALAHRAAQARESAAAKRQRAIDNATVAPRRTAAQSPADNAEDKMTAVSRVVPEASPLVLVRSEAKRTSPIPLKSSPPARVHAPVPTRASSNTRDLIPSVGAAKVSPRGEGPPSENGIVFQVSNPSPRNRRASPPKKPSLKTVSPPKDVPNSQPAQMLALPAPGDEHVGKEVEDNSRMHGALVSAVSAAMRDITALAASERKQAVLDVSQVKELPADKENDVTPSPPPSTPLDFAPTPAVPSRGRKHTSLTRSRKRATRIEVHPASAPASLASGGDEIRQQIALARRASGDVVPASRKVPTDVVAEVARVSIRKSASSPTQPGEKSPPPTLDTVPETTIIEVNDSSAIDATEKDEVRKVRESLTFGPEEEEPVTPLSFVVHDGHIPIPLPAPPLREEKDDASPETTPTGKVEDVQPSSPPPTSMSSIPSNAGSTPPLHLRNGSGNTLTSLPSPVPPPADNLPPALSPTSHDVVAEQSAPVSLLRTPPTPTNTLEIGPKGGLLATAAVGSDSSEEPGDPDEDLITDTAAEALIESRSDQTPAQGSPGSAPDSSPVTNSSDEREGAPEPVLETPTPAPLPEKVIVHSSPDRNPHVDMMPVPEEAPRFVPQRSRRPPQRPQRIILDDEDDRHLLYEPREVGPRRVRRRNDSRTRRAEYRDDDDEGGDPDADIDMEASMVSQDVSRDESREERRRRRQERRERKMRREQKRQQIAEYHEQMRAAAEAEGEVSDEYSGGRRARPVIGSDDESDADLDGNSLERHSRWSPPSADEQQYWRERERERERRKRSVSSGPTSRERKRRDREPTPHSRSDRVDRTRTRSSSRGRDERRDAGGRRKQHADDTLVRSSSRTRSASVGGPSRTRTPESWEAGTLDGSRRLNRMQRSSSREGERKRRSASAGAELRRDDGSKARRTSSERLRPMVPSRSRSALGATQGRERSSRRRHRSELGIRRQPHAPVNARPIYKHGAYEDSESDTANAKYIPWYCEGQSDPEEEAGDQLKCLYITGGGRFKCNHARCVLRRKRRRRLNRRGRHVSYHPELVWGDGEAINGRKY